MQSPTIPARGRDVIVYRDPHAYCAHPHMVRAADGSLVAVFNMVQRRPVVLHPPEDPLYRNVVIRSADDGETWTSPEVVPDYGWSGMECAGLTLLRDGRLMLNQWQFGWLPAGRARGRAGWTDAADLLARWSHSPEHETGGVDLAALRRQMNWARGPGRTIVHFSSDNGASFGGTVEIDTAPFSGGYGMRGGLEAADGRILLPLSDVPNYRTVFLVASGDGGRSWAPARAVAAGTGHEFEEPAILAGPGGRLLMVLRDNGTRRLHRCLSEDAGRSWGPATPLPVTGYPADLLRLRDGRILLTYGWRAPGFGIRATLSGDGGESWAPTILIRDGMRNGNLGYPVTVERADGALLTLYYGEDGSGVTAILGTVWHLPD